MTTKEANYTAEQEALIAKTAEDSGYIDNVLAEQLAEALGKDVRSIRGKAVRMGLYKAKQRATGSKLPSKEAIATEIAQLVGHNLDGLEKAPKPVLETLLNTLRSN